MALLARLVFLGLASAEVSRLESWHDIAGAASAGAGGTVVVPYVEVVPGAGWAEVPPNASVAIGSAGGATVNGTRASRFFVVQGELALSNLTLVDGYNGSYGGGVAVGSGGRGRRARARGGPRTRGGPGAPGQRPAVAPEDGPSQVFSSVDDEELATFAGGDEEPFFAGCCGTAPGDAAFCGDRQPAEPPA